MKKFNLLSVVVASLLLVAAVGCTTLTEAQDDYYNPGRSAAGNRVYVEDPYRGVVVLERDPWTGRYYEVNGFGRFDDRYYRGPVRRPVYGQRVYRAPVYRNNGNGNTYRRPSVPPRTQQSEQQRQDTEKAREEARKKVLGN